MRGRTPIVKDGWERESKEEKKKKKEMSKGRNISRKTEGERIGVLLFVPGQGLPTKRDAWLKILDYSVYSVVGRGYAKNGCLALLPNRPINISMVFGREPHCQICEMIRCKDCNTWIFYGCWLWLGCTNLCLLQTIHAINQERSQ